MLLLIAGPLAAFMLSSAQMEADTDYEQWVTEFNIALSGTSARDNSASAAKDAARIADDALAIIRARRPVWRVKPDR